MYIKMTKRTTAITITFCHAFFFSNSTDYDTDSTTSSCPFTFEEMTARKPKNAKSTPAQIYADVS